MTDTLAGAVQPPLWSDAATEPCDTAAEDERAHVDLHGQQQAITGDYGRSPSRGRRWADWVRGAEDVVVVGGWL
ncbi:hypothetical protein [Streptomyces flavidovirens]